MDATVVGKLKEYFESRDEVVMAFLFGSRSKDSARISSDWDMGVYLTSASRDMEQKIWGDVERICGASVDLIVLNRAPARIARSIVAESRLR